MKATMLVLILCSLVLAGCGVSFDIGIFGERIRGSGDIITEARAVSDFQRIDILGSGDLIITQGDHYSLTVETDDNLMEYVKTEVQGMTLELSYTEQALGKNLQPTQGFVYRVTVQELEAVEIAGSGTITAASLESEMLVITVAGSGEVRIDELTTDDLSLQIIGSGDADLGGVARQQSFVIAGSGTIDAGDLRGEAVVVTIPGSGSATVWATDSLQVNIAGSGDVDYYGRPAVSQTILGSGRVSGLGDK
jgi:hypothetical protein